MPDQENPDQNSNENVNENTGNKENPDHRDLTSLIGLVMDGKATEAQCLAFQEAMCASPESVAAYIEQADIHALLEWRSGQVEIVDDASPVLTQGSPILWQIRRYAAIVLFFACAASMAGAFWWQFGQSPDQGVSILTMDNVRWSGGQKPYVQGQSLDGPLKLDDGMVRLALMDGGELTLEGPAHFHIDQSRNMHLNRGRAILRTSGQSQQLYINGTQVRHEALLDDGRMQGKEALGIWVDEAGVSEVVVFGGRLRLSSNSEGALNLNKGEGLRIEKGRHSRIVSIERRTNGKWSASKSRHASLIQSVRDNLESKTQKFYQIVPGGLVEDAPAFVDRDHQWNGLDAKGIPAFLIGADLLMTFNDDKNKRREMELSLAPRTMLYVFWDNRVSPPSWLIASFVDTDEDIGQDEGRYNGGKSKTDFGAGKSIDNTFSIWRKPMPEGGKIILGDLGLSGRTGNVSVYGVAAKPMD